MQDKGDTEITALRGRNNEQTVKGAGVGTYQLTANW